MKSHRLLFSLLILSILGSCASKDKDLLEKEWTPEIDQYIRNSSGKITFARIHHIVARTKAMNRARKNKVLSVMRNTCPNKEFSLIRSYKSQSDFVTLKFDYRGNFPVFIYEFKCKN